MNRKIDSMQRPGLCRNIRCLVVLFLSCGSPLVAQEMPIAPVPSDFATAQSVFISSAGAPPLMAKEKLAVSMMYKGFYQQLSTWNKYKIATNPKDVDLTMEISIRRSIFLVDRGSSVDYPYLRLDVREAKTQALLWTLDEPVDSAFREKTFQHNVDTAVGLLIEDLKSLSAGQLPGPQ